MKAAYHGFLAATKDVVKSPEESVLESLRRAENYQIEAALDAGGVGSWEEFVTNATFECSIRRPT